MMEKVITLSELVANIRCRRSGKMFLISFINQCKDSNAVIIPPNVTNGDMIKAMFPNMHMDNECNGIWYGYTSNDPPPRKAPMLGVNLEWWNAPYKGSEG